MSYFALQAIAERGLKGNNEIQNALMPFGQQTVLTRNILSRRLIFLAKVLSQSSRLAKTSHRHGHSRIWLPASELSQFSQRLVRVTAPNVERSR
jgi:hypothetical protein